MIYMAACLQACTVLLQTPSACESALTRCACSGPFSARMLSSWVEVIVMCTADGGHVLGGINGEDLAKLPEGQGAVVLPAEVPRGVGGCCLAPIPGEAQLHLHILTPTTVSWQHRYIMLTVSNIFAAAAGAQVAVWCARRALASMQPVCIECCGDCYAQFLKRRAQQEMGRAYVQLSSATCRSFLSIMWLLSVCLLPYIESLDISWTRDSLSMTFNAGEWLQNHFQTPSAHAVPRLQSSSNQATQHSCQNARCMR